ncbi:hypothetical protein E2C01_059052 [Portunus trituberculatus]|uniref:Uncharacterized protein n=1 Tax=Portunus trituberculatus TaxID=210409 RepID=A0A5B7GY37_PORTR|nr:hypothetical protein [Portunus trituberculatus]
MHVRRSEPLNQRGDSYDLTYLEQYFVSAEDRNHVMWNPRPATLIMKRRAEAAPAGIWKSLSRVKLNTARGDSIFLKSLFVTRLRQSWCRGWCASLPPSLPRHGLAASCPGLLNWLSMDGADEGAAVANDTPPQGRRSHNLHSASPSSPREERGSDGRKLMAISPNPPMRCSLLGGSQ